MRVVASVQAKRGSSRGLVHYIAHSKLDPEREPQGSREVFNAFADELSVRSANNSMRVGIAKGRPSNDELHHIVLSFRDDDYRKLGEDESRRKKALKEITRAAMKSLETSVNAERLLWTAAVHRNTENPHVHIAIQKQYLSKEIERHTLTKIPRKALPHYEIREGEKVLISGYLIDAAAAKMDTIIEVERTRKKRAGRADRSAISKNNSGREAESEPPKKSAASILEERTILAKGIIAEYDLLLIGNKIDSLLDRSGEMRFAISDPITGKKKRLSLQEIQSKGARDETGQPTAAERQIRTILHKMLAKEEAVKDRLEKSTYDVIREARGIRSEYRKSGCRLPIPSLSKEDLDRLQEGCLNASDIRRFAYLEKVRTELVLSGEINQRSRDDFRAIRAKKNISELRTHLSEKMHKELNEKAYYLRVDIGERVVSLADLDREQKDRDNSELSFIEKIKAVTSRSSRNRTPPTRTNLTDKLRDRIAGRLAEQMAAMSKDAKVEKNKARVLMGILKGNPESALIGTSYSPEQLAEIEQLSLRLKLKTEYEYSWKEQRLRFESAGNESLAFRKSLKADPAANFAEHKSRIIAGRALAREIINRTVFDQAKDDLKSFRDGKRFQKFAIADKRSSSTSYLSMHDVDLPRGNSLLDRAVNQLFESREHRNLRRTVSSLGDAKGRRLNDDLMAAKELMISASRNASEFKDFSYFGLKSGSAYQPIFTHPEIAMLEHRASKTRDPKEAERLRNIVESSADRSVRSLGDLLRDFETPIAIHSQVKETDASHPEPAKDRQQQVGEDRSTVVRRSERSVEGHSR
ncbi:MAG: hypothetical protein KF756_08045 [Acidobacteria bacterium]|nr:hypothetical protein [Acidobacteriota bacterium]